MWGTKTDLDRILGRYVGLGFEVKIRRDSGWLRVECHTSDQTLRFLFGPNGDIHGDIEKTLENAPKNEPTAVEIIDARLYNIEREGRDQNVRLASLEFLSDPNSPHFDKRICESIKRLSESGQITSSSGNAINVKGAPDPNDDEVLTDDKGDPIVVGSGFVSAWNSGSFEPADERPSPKSSGKEYTNAEIEKYGTKIEVGAGDFPEAELDGFIFYYTGRDWHWIDGSPINEPAEELPHTLPPHIMWLVRQAIHADSQAKSMKEINTPELEGDLRSHKVARKELNKTLAAAVIKYFGGES